ncbi:MAG: DUF6514 family protein [Ruminococcus sp.]|nr:DUF6514 family protein [Ruminococcus sp.]
MTYKISISNFCSHTEYGIEAFDGNTLLKSIDCITDSRSDIEKITSLCNELNIELCHLDDIIEDYLTDFCI